MVIALLPEGHKLRYEVADLARSPMMLAAEDPIARLQIERLDPIGTQQVREGVSHDILSKGTGHYPGTALPGHSGNTVILGHRTTAPAPFMHLDRMRAGDLIKLTLRSTTYTYQVYGRRITSPTDRTVLEPASMSENSTHKNMLALVTCHPKGSDRYRLIVLGRLVESREASLP